MSKPSFKQLSFGQCGVKGLLLFGLCLAAVPMVSADKEGLQDPTLPLGASSAKKAVEETLILNSVLIGEQRKVAVINGQYLSEQDTIKASGGGVLERIMPHAVMLNKAGKRWRISLQQTAIVQKRRVNQ